jgi:transcriptional regulator GlxA family with amidase domain
MPRDYRIRKVLEFLERDPAKSVPELASLVNLSSSRLGHLFKIHMGVDLSHFLANERLEKAADLLRQTELSIKEIAAIVGYHHSSSFDRGFQNKFGMAPADFRRQHRKEFDSVQKNNGIARAANE